MLFPEKEHLGGWRAGGWGGLDFSIFTKLKINVLRKAFKIFVPQEKYLEIGNRGHEGI